MPVIHWLACRLPASIDTQTDPRWAEALAGERPVHSFHTEEKHVTGYHCVHAECERVHGAHRMQRYRENEGTGRGREKRWLTLPVGQAARAARVEDLEVGARLPDRRRQLKRRFSPSKIRHTRTL